MAVLVIAGSGRGAGKTAVGVGLIKALPGFEWMVMKISPHVHGTDGKPDVAVEEEWGRDSDKDTSRYLAAGADRAFLIENVPHEALVRWIVEERRRESEDDALLAETNALDAREIAREREPAVLLAVVAGPEAEWKPSLRERIGMADALVLGAGVMPDHLPADLQKKPLFATRPGVWVTPELVAFVQERLTLND